MVVIEQQCLQAGCQWAGAGVGPAGWYGARDDVVGQVQVLQRQPRPLCKEQQASTYNGIQDDAGVHRLL